MDRVHSIVEDVLRDVRSQGVEDDALPTPEDVVARAKREGVEIDDHHEADLLVWTLITA